MDLLCQPLQAHQFTRLFLDSLGWDRAIGSNVIEVDERKLTFESIAQKRGLQVFLCRTDRRVLMNRRLLRQGQAAIAKICHEHILIYCSEEPQKQVWQWAIRLPDGRRLRHREHPFFSTSVPRPFLTRLSQLRFSLEEEDGATLLDALSRVRRALDTSAELDLFAKRPWYAERSDELAVAMRMGDESAFHKFVIFHLPFARSMSKKLRRLFGMLPEDAEQIATIGLIHAARRFQPERGFQFSTYATWWVRQVCQRYGPEFAMLIRLPPNVFWKCFKQTSDVERIRIVDGPTSVRDWVAAWEVDEPDSAMVWQSYLRARNITTLSMRGEPAFREAREIPDTDKAIDCSFITNEQTMLVRAAIARLRPREAEFIRLRYGVDCREHTLEEVGLIARITRERVRQIQGKAEEKLRYYLQRLAPEGCALDRSRSETAPGPDREQAETPELVETT